MIGTALSVFIFYSILLTAYICACPFLLWDNLCTKVEHVMDIFWKRKEGKDDELTLIGNIAWWFFGPPQKPKQEK